MDWLESKIRDGKNSTIEPQFIVNNNVKDILIKNGTLMGVWDDQTNEWKTGIQAVRDIVDAYISEEANRMSRTPLLCRDSSSKMNINLLDYIDQMDNFNGEMDSKIRYLNTPSKRGDYCTKRCNYEFKEGDISAWETLISTLYDPKERHKIEWGIGAISSGASATPKFQKMFVLRGAPGSGKSTILNVITEMFGPYVGTFSAKDLTDKNNAFASDALKGNPLVAINNDGDLSKVSEESLLNSIVAHDKILVNPKYAKQFEMRPFACLWMATNSAIKYTSINSGTVRRIIDIHPSGRKLKPDDYDDAMNTICSDELGAIAYHCAKLYKKNPNYYVDYIPQDEVRTFSDTHDFICENIEYIKEHEDEGIKTKDFWGMYKLYCADSNITPKSRTVWRDAMYAYFGSHTERLLKDFIFEKIQDQTIIESQLVEPNKPTIPGWLVLTDHKRSLIDDILADCPAQYSSNGSTPDRIWSEVTTCLRNIDTTKVHFVQPGINHIVVDADCKNSLGDKDQQECINAIVKLGLPKTYAENSKGGQGIHLHYIYDGDPTNLVKEIAPNVEVKVYGGHSGLRRRLSKCNDVQPAKLPDGYFPKKEAKVTQKEITDVKHLNNLINKALCKKVFPNTAPSMSFIKKITDEAYESGMTYDIRCRFNDILRFAQGSTHQKDFCMGLLDKIHWNSDDIDKPESPEDKPIVFYDIEVKPNMNLVCWKYLDDPHVEKWFNPTPDQVNELITSNRLIGFNNLRYDNHILMCMLYGFSPEKIFEQSTGLVGDTIRPMQESKNVSYMDLYDLATVKQSLKKYEIDLGIMHIEHETPWDQPCPPEEWESLGIYCANDVEATEAVYKHLLNTDVNARLILSSIAGGTPNWSNNNLTAKMIFGDNRNPNSSFNYRFMGDSSAIDHVDPEDPYTAFDKLGRPIFPGYTFDNSKGKRDEWSTYRGEHPGEGGYVYAEPGVYENVALLDIASMHPSSIVAEKLFGDTYTARYQELLNLRIAIKHKDWDTAKTMLDGAAAGYLDDPSKAKALSKALKIPINSVYGLTSASFMNQFKDIRNVDNIVAKRGALFMINLKHRVQEKGFTVAHIKTDSIKIPNATPDIIQFVMDYGKQYGYNFEHEATYEKMCLVNNAVYIAKYDHPDEDGHIWTATGAQFQEPYVFKRLFTHEPILFEDCCIAKSVQTAIYISTEKDGITNREFVGKCGNFVPVNLGYGYAGELVRSGKARDGSEMFASVTGAKGYLWMLANVIKSQFEDPMSVINFEYFEKLAAEAHDDICGFIEKSTCSIHTWDDFIK